MNEFLLGFIEYITNNFDLIVSNTVNFIAGIFVLYGVVLALDANRRYQSALSAVIVFILWIFFSLIFLPIYLVVRPQRLLDEQKVESAQYEALLIGNDLNHCDNCSELIKNNDSYCHHCGHKNIKTCHRCHAQSEETWEYCNKCGYQFTDVKKKRNIVIKTTEKYTTKIKNWLKEQARKNDEANKAREAARLERERAARAMKAHAAKAQVPVVVPAAKVPATVPQELTSTTQIVKMEAKEVQKLNTTN